MLKRLAIVALFSALTAAGQNTQPLLQPFTTFVDASGSPCSGCKLYSYIAGTTTAQPTYTDASGLTQNTNPTTLNVAGGGQIWMKSTNAYKFVLTSPLGTTIWTVDNVPAVSGGGGGGGAGYLPIAGGTMTGALTTSSVDGAVNAASLPGDDIGAAITAQVLTMGGEGTIEIPDGTYDFANTITISQAQFSQMTIHCHSRNAVLNYTGSGDAIYVTSSTNSAAQVKIENCSIFGSGASGTANGIHLVDSQNVRLNNVFVYAFPGDNLYGFGSIDTQSEGSDYSQAGHWNIHLKPDLANQFASNGNLFHGGSVQYGGSGNVWDEGDYSAYDGDANNLWDHVTSELSANVPHYIIEGTKGDAIKNSYIEYINFATSTADLYAVILGNYTDSGFGSGVSRPAVDFTFSGNRMIVPSAGSGTTVAALYLVNTNWLKIDQLIEDGNPTYGISFYASGTNSFDFISGVNMGYATALYQNAPAPHNLLWWPVDATPGLGQYTIYNDGQIHFGGIVSSNDVTATANFKNSHGTVIPSTVTGTHGTGVKIQMSDNTGVNGNYAKFGSTGELVDSGVAVGGSGGSTDFGSMTGGTNTAAVMVVGSGATLGPTGTGAITATALTGSPAITVTSCDGCQHGSTGTLTYTGNHTLALADDGMQIAMNCATACVLTAPATQPSTTFRVPLIISIGAGAATMALGGSDTFNGGTTAPAIPAAIWANTVVSTAYRGWSFATSGGGGSSTPTDLGTITYTAAGTTTFAAASAAAAAGVVTATHSTSTTFSPTGLVKWGSYTVEIKQDATGGGTTFTLGTAGTCSAWKVGGGGGGAITLSSSASAIDLLSFTYDGTNCVANFRPLFN